MNYNYIFNKIFLLREELSVDKLTANACFLTYRTVQLSHN